MTEAREVKLKPCPFCGGPAELIDDPKYTGYFKVMCMVCNGRSDGCGTIDDTVTEWNTRPAEQELVDALNAVAGWHDQSPLPELRIAEQCLGEPFPLDVVRAALTKHDGGKQ